MQTPSKAPALKAAMTHQPHFVVLCLLLSPFLLVIPYTAEAVYAIEDDCFNGIDDDGDALVDCDDPECEPGYFKLTIVDFEELDSHNVALGKLDNNDSIDAFVANKNGDGNTVWINDGSGVFSSNGQSLGNSDSLDCQLADLDGDLDLDAFVVNNGQPNRIYLNDGDGNFVDSGQPLGSSSSQGVELGDLDGDGDIDAFVVNNNQPNRVWINQGGDQQGPGSQGEFLDSGQSLGTLPSLDVALGDIDGDGDLDAFVANGGFQTNVVWINQGYDQGGTEGVFDPQVLSQASMNSRDVALVDLDGDDDLDAVVANLNQSNNVWINQGGDQPGNEGEFSLGQALGVGASWGVDTGDLNGDQRPDVFIANYNQPHRVWFNDQNGNLVDSGQALGQAISSTVVLGDLDGDGDLDGFVTNMQANHLWINNMLQSCNDDLDGDGIPNSCDLDLVLGADCDQDGQADSCQLDTDGDGTIDPCDSDLDGDGVANDCDIDQTNGPDCDGNGIDDSCDPDENGNGIPDACDLFRRGDVNTDGSVNIADPIALINYVLGLYETTCVDAADVNDNGNVNIVDIVHLLLMIMDGAPQIPAPGIINCGPDPTADALDCVSYDGC
ncbi:MAG: hypothetical protein CMJ95_08440 [Planctomycetes bacterium]|nr:hypothetical protein [Planctomycetota bacterium]